MIELLWGLLVAGVVLVVLRLGAELCWRVFETSAAALLERCQVALHQRRVEQRHRALQQAMRELEQRQLEQDRSRRIVDLDGQPRAISPGEWGFFLNRCLSELELEANLESLSWSTVRQHWRRQSLAWHPDRGGSVQAWLRKQRAYEALKELLPHLALSRSAIRGSAGIRDGE